MPREFGLSQYTNRKHTKTSVGPKKNKATLQENDANLVSKENSPPIADSWYLVKSGAAQDETSSHPIVPILNSLHTLILLNLKTYFENFVHNDYVSVERPKLIFINKRTSR